MNRAVLIPAYKPDEKLIKLIGELKDDFFVLVVDDGSGDEYAHIFKSVEDLGAHVLHHEVNMGKGAGLKSGIRYLKENGAENVVTADSDGQHTPEDIRKVSDAMEQHPHTFITGRRDFSKMPLRSKLGNSITCFLFKASTGIRITDTQTGLRGIPACLFDQMLQVEGDRYEYEMNALLMLKKWDAKYMEVPISTVYIDGNKSSHFRAVSDGLRVIIRVLSYAAASLISTGVDYFLYILLHAFSLPVAVCYIIARIISSFLNYQLNCRMVFGGKPTAKNALGYALLVLVIMGIGSLSVTLLSHFNVHGVLAKLMIDVVLFVVNYFVQNKIIFAKKK